jgi:hypothetical protein
MIGYYTAGIEGYQFTLAYPMFEILTSVELAGDVVRVWRRRHRVQFDDKNFLYVDHITNRVGFELSMFFTLASDSDFKLPPFDPKPLFERCIFGCFDEKYMLSVFNSIWIAPGRAMAVIFDEMKEACADKRTDLAINLCNHTHPDLRDTIEPLCAFLFSPVPRSHRSVVWSCTIL